MMLPRPPDLKPLACTTPTGEFGLARCNHWLSIHREDGTCAVTGCACESWTPPPDTRIELTEPDTGSPWEPGLAYVRTFVKDWPLGLFNGNGPAHDLLLMLGVALRAYDAAVTPQREEAPEDG